jgi:hypothetical protein
MEALIAPQKFGSACCAPPPINRYIRTSFSLLARCRDTPSQDMSIGSSNLDQCTAHSATTVPPHHHRNCQKNQHYQEGLNNPRATSLAQSNHSKDIYSLLKPLLGTPNYHVLTINLLSNTEHLPYWSKTWTVRAHWINIKFVVCFCILFANVSSTTIRI